MSFFFFKKKLYMAYNQLFDILSAWFGVTIDGCRRNILRLRSEF